MMFLVIDVLMSEERSQQQLLSSENLAIHI